MKRKTELEKMKNWASIMDTVVKIIGILVQVCCGASAVLILAMNVFKIFPSENVTMNLSILGYPIQFESLSTTWQMIITVMMAVICILVIFMVRDLSKALHNVFQPMSNGRPFEEDAVNGFRKAAILCLIIAVLSMNISVFIIAALLMLLSYVFHYGMILQTESDETL